MLWLLVCSLLCVYYYKMVWSYLQLEAAYSEINMEDFDDWGGEFELDSMLKEIVV